MRRSLRGLTGARAVQLARTAAFGWALIESPACVPKARYDQCLADGATAKAGAEAKQKDDAARVQSLVQQVSEAEAAMQERDSKLSELSTSGHNLQSQLDEATAINKQLRDELTRLGKDVDKILAERGTLAKALDDAKLRLDELRMAQAAAEARAELFRDFGRRLRPLVDARQIDIQSRRGQLVLVLFGDLLFEPLRADLRVTGKGAVMEIAHALQTALAERPGRRFMVTSNLDPQDPKVHPVKSAWELTAARSVAVVEYLVSLGVAPNALTAAAAASFDPLVPNVDALGRAKNRRIEIALAPAEDAVTAALPGK